MAKMEGNDFFVVDRVQRVFLYCKSEMIGMLTAVLGSDKRNVSLWITFNRLLDERLVPVQ